VGAVSASIHRATGGNPFYVLELLRGLKRGDRPSADRVIEDVFSRGKLDGVALQLGARLRNLSPHALHLAQAIGILGDGCELRHAAAISQTQIDHAITLATELVRLDVLGDDRPPRFIHPIVQYAVLQTLSGAEHDAAHRRAAGVLYTEGLPPGRIAAHVKRLRPVGDCWAVERLCEGARAALENGAPAAATDLFERGLAEPPPAEIRVEVLRAAARAELPVGRAGRAVWEAGGGRQGVPSTKSVLAEGMAQRSDLAGALVLIDEAIAQVERAGWEERCHYAEILRIRGRLLALKGDLAGAERAYIASLDWARTQQPKSWGLRTTTSYARLMCDQGRVGDARALLAPIYGWFTEGFDTADLKEAKGLLDGLR
jgi:hypothetical protein